MMAGVLEQRRGEPGLAGGAESGGPASQGAAQEGWQPLRWLRQALTAPSGQQTWQPPAEVDKGRQSDFILWLLSSTFFLPAILLRIWLLEGLPALALSCVPHVLLMAWLAWLAGCRPAAYVAFREPLCAFALVDCTFMVRRIAANGGANFFLLHGGSFLKLSALMIICGHAVWCHFYMLYHRMPLRWSALAGAAAALLPLSTGESICHRLLAAPGVEAPLSEIYGLVDTLHNVMLPVPTIPPDGSTHLEKCLALDAYILLVLGVGLPALLLRQMERSLRWRRLRQRRRRSGSYSDARLAAEGRSAQLYPDSGWMLELYTMSAVVWWGVLHLRPWLARLAGAS